MSSDGLSKGLSERESAEVERFAPGVLVQVGSQVVVSKDEFLCQEVRVMIIVLLTYCLVKLA